MQIIFQFPAHFPFSTWRDQIYVLRHSNVKLSLEKFSDLIFVKQISIFLSQFKFGKTFRMSKKALNSILAIFFDLDNTLIQTRKADLKTVKEVSEIFIFPNFFFRFYFIIIEEISLTHTQYVEFIMTFKLKLKKEKNRSSLKNLIAI